MGLQVPYRNKRFGSRLLYVDSSHVWVSLVRSKSDSKLPSVRTAKKITNNQQKLTLVATSFKGYETNPLFKFLQWAMIFCSYLSSSAINVCYGSQAEWCAWGLHWFPLVCLGESLLCATFPLSVWQDSESLIELALVWQDPESYRTCSGLTRSGDPECDTLTATLMLTTPSGSQCVAFGEDVLWVCSVLLRILQKQVEWKDR